MSGQWKRIIPEGDDMTDEINKDAKTDAPVVKSYWFDGVLLVWDEAKKQYVRPGMP